MGILLGQLPPNEVARLKAELAETLIANFCYPRFFDYRTGSLRMRPIDRTKRQEVWLFLSSVDFTSWSRVDLMSPDFQRQIERLFIHFVQRNRNFFGDQGRKRMIDVRMLISSCATSVTEGLRSHLKGHQQSSSSFGSPRPVFSWATTNVTNRPEPNWEQLASRTMLIQQQLQEVRGEIKSSAAANNGTTTAQNETRPATTRRSTRGRSNGNSASSVEREMRVSPTPNITVSKPMLPEETSFPTPSATATPAPMVETSSPTPPTTAPTPVAGPKTTTPLNPPTDSAIAPASTPAPTNKVEPTVLPIDIPVSPAPSALPTPEASVKSSDKTQTPLTAVTVGKSENTTVLINDEDVVIFEQMRHQLVVWLRVEAVRSGADISGQGPIQLLELLHRQDSVDDSRLEVVSTLLGLSDQVITNRRASLIEYKQAMMFYLMHTRRS